MLDFDLSPRPALPELRGGCGTGNGITVRELRGLGMATMVVRKGQAESLRERIRSHFLVELPQRPACAAAGGVRFIGTGLGSWFVMKDGGSDAFGAALRQVTTPLASVSDQSGGFAAFQIGGPNARETLAKGFTIDLDPVAFARGDAATTIVSHIGATIWRDDDDVQGRSVFGVVVFRSLASSFWHWLSSSSADCKSSH
jgi:heterotetrameric sarcosine oxidase gamma subunit